jgi:hypothetical protein
MWHAILSFLAGLLPSAPASHCPYHPMLAHGDNVSRPVMVASAIPYVPCSLAVAGRLAQLGRSGVSNG